MRRWQSKFAKEGVLSSLEGTCPKSPKKALSIRNDVWSNNQHLNKKDMVWIESGEVVLVVKELVKDGHPIGSNHEGFFMLTTVEDIEWYRRGKQLKIDKAQVELNRVVEAATLYIQEKGDVRTD